MTTAEPTATDFYSGGGMTPKDIIEEFMDNTAEARGIFACASAGLKSLPDFLTEREEDRGAIAEGIVKALVNALDLYEVASDTMIRWLRNLEEKRSRP